jgi:ABC-type transport system involved in multi-copper enzyme maturation permease subunit
MAQSESEFIFGDEAVAAPEPAPRRAGFPERLRGLGASLARITVDNPVMVKEFRTRMRGTRAYWLLLGYTLLLAGVLAVMYFTFEAEASSQPDWWVNGGSSRAARDLGRWMYGFTFIAQALMVALITPAITAGAVTIEREQRSYELLVTTPLRPVDLIRGKLTAAVSFVVLLLTVSLPLVSLSFLAGGVSPAEVFFSYLLIGLGAFVYGALGIFWSAALRTTAAATITTYLTVLAFGITTFVPGIVAFGASVSRAGGSPEIPFQSVNPVMATLNCVRPEYLFSVEIPSWVSGATINFLLGLLIAICAMGRLEHFDPPRPIWPRGVSTVLWAAAGVFLFAPLMGGASNSWNTPLTVQQSLGGFLITMLAFCALATPIFNTGDLLIRRGESAVKRYLSGLLPHRMFHDDLSCGVPLLIFWTVFLLALVPIGIAAAGKWMFFNPEAVYIPAVILTLAVVAALAGIGNFLSVTLPSRWAACVLTYLAGVVLMLLPYLTLAQILTLGPRTREIQPLAQLLYLAPSESLSQLADRASFTAQHPAFLFENVVPNWVVTTIIYLGIAALCFVLTLFRIRQADVRLQQEMAQREAAIAA